MKRRRFIQTVGLTGAAILAAPGRTIAGPFKPGDFSGSQVPVDKKLDPAWVRSLRERGTPTTYLKSKAELRYIGMPVGGICAGTMYLGGDGRLWLWDIFNRNQPGIDARVIEWKGTISKRPSPPPEVGGRSVSGTCRDRWKPGSSCSLGR